MYTYIYTYIYSIYLILFIYYTMYIHNIIIFTIFWKSEHFLLFVGFFRILQIVGPCNSKKC